MAYSLPVFNLQCNIGQITPITWRLTRVPCNLAWGRRVNVASTGGTGTVGVPLLLISLLLPALTDVRGPVPPYAEGATGADVIEVPAGSGRLYVAAFVDDIGKGFANEHRCAMLFQKVQPIPLP